MKNNKIAIGGTFLALTALGAGTAYLLKTLKTSLRNIEPVKNFNVNKFLGKWYEIAEIGCQNQNELNNITVEYNLNKDSSIQITKNGYNFQEGEFQEIVAKAEFVDSPAEGKMKISFIRPFYSAYNIIAIDPEYKYALIVGKDINHLWLLSRETSIPENILDDYLKQAENIGFDLDNLQWVRHEEYELIIEEIDILV